jgi:hypothetical protein
MCGYLEDYFSATAKVQKSQSKDYEKILKVSSRFESREVIARTNVNIWI